MLAQVDRQISERFGNGYSGFSADDLTPDEIEALEKNVEETWSNSTDKTFQAINQILQVVETASFLNPAGGLAIKGGAFLIRLGATIAPKVLEKAGLLLKTIKGGGKKLEPLKIRTKGGKKDQEYFDGIKVEENVGKLSKPPKPTPAGGSQKKSSGGKKVPGALLPSDYIKELRPPACGDLPEFLCAMIWSSASEEEKEKIKKEGYKEALRRLTDFSVSLPEKKKKKPLVPLMGVVTPLVKIGYYNEIVKGNPKKSKLVDLSYYLRVISVSWEDTDTTWVSTFTITCAYHPHTMMLPAGMTIFPQVGTQEGKLLSLGAFYLAKTRKEITSANSSITLVFTAVNYGKPRANTPQPPDQCIKVTTYKEVIERVAKVMGSKVDVSNVQPASILEKEYTEAEVETLTDLSVLDRIAKRLNLALMFRKNTIIFEDYASAKKKVEYVFDLSYATSFQMDFEHLNQYTSAQVISSSPQKSDKKQKDPKKIKPIMGIAGTKDKSGNASGRVFTRYLDVKTKEEATREAQNLLIRVNRHSSNCRLTIPNCFIFAGHNILINQSVLSQVALSSESGGEPPVEFRIRHATHEVSNKKWEVVLDLETIILDDQTKAYQDREAFVKIQTEISKLIVNFEKVAHNKATVEKYAKKFIKNLKDAGKESDDGSVLTSLALIQQIAKQAFSETYETKNNPNGNTLQQALKTFKEGMATQEKELNKLGTTLETIGRPTSKYVKKALEYFAEVATKMVTPQSDSAKA